MIYVLAVLVSIWFAYALIRICLELRRGRVLELSRPVVMLLFEGQREIDEGIYRFLARCQRWVPDAELVLVNAGLTGNRTLALRRLARVYHAILVDVSRFNVKCASFPVPVRCQGPCPYLVIGDRLSLRPVWCVNAGNVKQETGK